GGCVPGGRDCGGRGARDRDETEAARGDRPVDRRGCFRRNTEGCLIWSGTLGGGSPPPFFFRHCEERSDEAIQEARSALDCFGTSCLAMTKTAGLCRSQPTEALWLSSTSRRMRARPSTF